MTILLAQLIAFLMLSWIKSEKRFNLTGHLFICPERCKGGMQMSVPKNSFLTDDSEIIIQMEIERLKTFKDHPFHVKDDEDMKALKVSIEKYGILNPLIVRPLKEGVYEIVSGHRRKHAAEQLGYRKVPVIIRVMRDEESVIAMVDAVRP